MRKLISLICLMGLLTLIPAAVLIYRGLPADTQGYVEKKYSGWNGVLRAWVCSRFSGSASFTGWLNSCAADFERAHEGVYIEFTPVSAQAMAELGQNGIRPPELLFFSPGVLRSPAGLREVDLPGELRGDLAACGGGYALPVALGGYIWVYNPDLCGGAPEAGSGTLVGLPDGDGRSFSAAATALLSDVPRAQATQAPEPGIDLGLPASAGAAEVSASEEALTQFIQGELPFLCVSQQELYRLARLKEAGQGPEWVCAGGGGAAYTDQILLAGIVAQQDADGLEREALAAEFARMLCNSQCQQQLARVGAFPVTGARIYEQFSPYAALDAQLNGRQLLVPNCFWDPAAFETEALLRARWAGALSGPEALAQLAEILNLH